MMADESSHTDGASEALTDRCLTFAAPQAAGQAKFLRAIGQDLEARGISSFSLSFAGDHYRLRSAVRCNRVAAPRPSRFWFSRRPETPEPVPTDIYYSYEDIERLDQSGRAKRGPSSGSADFLSLPQQLRAVGAIADRKRAQLLRLDRVGGENWTPSLTVQMRMPDGNCVVEKHSASNLYDVCVRMYKTRKGQASSFALSDAR
jgi:hypothetical protein